MRRIFPSSQLDLSHWCFSMEHLTNLSELELDRLVFRRGFLSTMLFSIEFPHRWRHYWAFALSDGAFTNPVPAFSRGMIHRSTLLRELNETCRRPAQGFGAPNSYQSHSLKGSLLVVTTFTLPVTQLSICVP